MYTFWIGSTTVASPLAVDFGSVRYDLPTARDSALEDVTLMMLGTGKAGVSLLIIAGRL
jgi:hypothetical protein